MSPAKTARSPDTREGERLKNEALCLLEDYRQDYIRRARRALLERLLASGTATADHVVESLEPVPDGIDPRFRGAVPKDLVRAGIIRRSGFIASTRPARHASIQTVWELADRAAALAWLADNPDLPDSDLDED
jgi:hypothetical protein